MNTGTGSEMADNETENKGPAAIRLLDSVIVFSNSIGSVWVFLLVLLVTADAIGRTLSFTGLTAPIVGVIEIVEVSIIVIVFTQLADTVRIGRLTRSDGFLNMTLRRSPAVGQVLSLFIECLGAVFLILILVGQIPAALQVIRTRLLPRRRGHIHLARLAREGRDHLRSRAHASAVRCQRSPGRNRNSARQALTRSTQTTRNDVRHGAN